MDTLILGESYTLSPNIVFLILDSVIILNAYRALQRHAVANREFNIYLDRYQYMSSLIYRVTESTNHIGCRDLKLFKSRDFEFFFVFPLQTFANNIATARHSQFKAAMHIRSCAMIKNANFLISISLQPDVVDRYFKL